jgi:AcrR family transcriptional regulator
MAKRTANARLPVERARTASIPKKPNHADRATAAPRSKNETPKAISPLPTTEGRWRRIPQERPSHILSAALEAFVENGFAATRLEDVAQRAGVSKGTLYLYFDGKEALFKAAVRDNIVPFIERAEQHVAEFQGSSNDLLVEVVRQWWRDMHESRMTGLPKLVLSEASNFPEAARVYFDEVVLRVRRLFASVLRRGIERGEFRAVDVDYTVRVLMAPLVMALIWKHSLVKCQIDGIEFERHLNALIDLVLHGVVSVPERRP